MTSPRRLFPVGRSPPIAIDVLGERLSTDVTKTSAVDLQKVQVGPTHNQQTQTMEPPMTNNREHLQEGLRRQILAEANIHAPENISTTAEIEHWHNAPTSGSARPARSRATSTPMQEVGCASTRKASSTTVRHSRSREEQGFDERAKPRLTQLLQGLWRHVK